MKWRSTIVVVFGALTVSSIGAQVNVGAGTEICGQWSESRTGNANKDIVTRYMMLSWVQGYLMGYAHGGAREKLKEKLVNEAAEQVAQGNLSSSQLNEKIEVLTSDDSLHARLKRQYGTQSGFLFDVPEAKAIEDWLGKYCQEHPTDPIVQAAVNLRDELMGN